MSRLLSSVVLLLKTIIIRMKMEVRKGAWTNEEDHLLKSYIEKYGEGKWHQVPLHAGLNRCRKSCRMRWLNYLKPNIKRGDFEEDEIDLMIRLRKLLGNRWSLIAGRLPGRTSNDVKNYWNARRRKRMDFNKRAEKTKTIVIRPRPRTLTKNFHYLNAKFTPPSKPIELLAGNSSNSSSTSPTMDNNGIIDDWRCLLDEDFLANFEDTPSISSIGVSSVEHDFEMELWQILQEI